MAFRAGGHCGAPLQLQRIGHHSSEVPSIEGGKLRASQANNQPQPLSFVGTATLAVDFAACDAPLAILDSGMEQDGTVLCSRKP